MTVACVTDWVLLAPGLLAIALAIYLAYALVSEWRREKTRDREDMEVAMLDAWWFWTDPEVKR